MAEIAALPFNGYKVVSTFSGCGGSSLGYRMAGFKVLWANEFVKEAQDVYRANFPDTILDTRDIRRVDPGDILTATGLKRGELDLLDGSPPCSSFSTAGKRAKGWGKSHAYSTGRVQRTDDLFFEYVRLLDGLQPRAFVAENVSGLVKGVGKGYFLDILAALRGAGYRVAARLLDAQWLGVPQARQRLIFVGTRLDLDVEPAFPAPLAYRYSVRDALPWISSIMLGKHGFVDQRDLDGRTPLPTVMAHGLTSFKYEVGARVIHDTSGVEPEADMRRFAVGRELDKLGQGEQSARYFQLTRAGLAEPSGTITARGGDASTAAVAHPTECRKFSIAELRRICAFPDDFVLTGTYAQQWERLGRAVPPVMMRAIAETIRDRVLPAATREKGRIAPPLGRAA
jgi:DNA (cytosine-5)-methyltransferase 1